MAPRLWSKYMSSFDTFQWKERGITIHSYPMGWRRFFWPRWMTFPSGVRLKIGLRHTQTANSEGLGHDEYIEFVLKRMGNEGSIVGRWRVLSGETKELAFRLPKLTYADTYKIDAILLYGRRERVLETGIISLHVFPNYAFYTFFFVPIAVIILERGFLYLLRLALQ